MPEREDLNIDAADRELVDALSRLTPSPVEFDVTDVSFRHGQRSMTRQLRAWQGMCAASIVTLLGLVAMQIGSAPSNVSPSSDARQAHSDASAGDTTELEERSENIEVHSARASNASVRDAMLISGMSDLPFQQDRAGYDAVADDHRVLRRSMLPEPTRAPVSAWTDTFRVLLGPGKS